mgnify:CR=1 FL=1
MTENLEFLEFPKMPRLSREIIITEKIDGTNAQLLITESGEMPSLLATWLIKFMTGWNPISTMPAFGKNGWLSDSEIKAVIAYLKTIN